MGSSLLNFLYQLSLSYKYNNMSLIEIDKELNKLNNKDDLYKEYINYFKTTLILFFQMVCSI